MLVSLYNKLQIHTNNLDSLEVLVGSLLTENFEGFITDRLDHILTQATQCCGIYLWGVGVYLNTYRNVSSLSPCVPLQNMIRSGRCHKITQQVTLKPGI